MIVKTEIHDVYGRSFKTLRVSLTNVCNLACMYCVQPTKEKSPFVSSEKILNYKEIALLVKKIHAHTNLHTIRLTGGEPTLYNDLIPFIKEIKSIGIETIKMTSNGYLLGGMIPELVQAGLKEINISLDTLEADGFSIISGKKNIKPVLESIEKALEHRMKVKINTVVLKGVNDDQIITLLEFSRKRNITLRFLELMRMGPLFQTEEFEKYFFSEEKILTKIEEAFAITPLIRENSSTANYWKTLDGYRFGIIANESSPFCQDCNRLRLDSYGNVYGCLSNNNAVSIVDADELKMQEKLILALSHKQELKFTGSAISMMAIGG